eukprot:740223-Prymnesium_polylepis.1
MRVKDRGEREVAPGDSAEVWAELWVKGRGTSRLVHVLDVALVGLVNVAARLLAGRRRLLVVERDGLRHAVRVLEVR